MPAFHDPSRQPGWYGGRSGRGPIGVGYECQTTWERIAGGRAAWWLLPVPMRPDECQANPGVTQCALARTASECHCSSHWTPPMGT